MSQGLVLDAGALIGLDRGERRVVALLEVARQRQLPITVPATALAQVLRRASRQVRLMRLLRQPLSEVVPLGLQEALAVGQLLAASGTSDVVDAHVVVCALRSGRAVITSDAVDLRRLHPAVRLIEI